MILFRLFFKLILVSVAALAGNMVGYEMREQMLEKPGHDLRFYHKGEEGEITIAVNPLLTNFLPALLVGMLTRPGCIRAFVLGAALAVLLGDEYEDRLYALFGVE